MRVPSAIRRVLRQEVEPQGRQRLVRAPAVHPQQLQLADADQVRIAPEFRQEEAAETENAAVPYPHCFVERVRAVAEASTAQ